MKILFCDNSLRDLLNFRGEVLRAYAKDGCEVVLVAPPTCTYETTMGNVRYIPIDMERSGMNPLHELKYFYHLWKIYRKEKPDYIFHYTIKPNIYGSMAAKLCGIPSTAMIAGLGYVFNSNGWGSRFARRLMRFALQFPRHIFVLNEHNKKVVLEKKLATSNQIILLSGGEGINLASYK